MANSFRAALVALSGSRTSVQAATSFFFAAPGAAEGCAAVLCAHAAALPGQCFVERLRVLYVVNEALGLGAAAADVVTALLAALPTLLGLAAAVAPDDEARAKLPALVRLWESRSMVPADSVATLLHACARPGSDASATASDPPVPAGALPALVRRAGAGYSPLPRADAHAAASRRSLEALPAAAAQPYYDLRLAKFDDETAHSRTRSRAAAEAAGA